MQEVWGGQVLRQGQQIWQIHLEQQGRESGGQGRFPGLTRLLPRFSLSCAVPWSICGVSEVPAQKQGQRLEAI